MHNNRINEKYVNMLQRTYEKYRLLDVRTGSLSSSSTVLTVQNDGYAVEENRSADMSCHAHDNIPGKNGCQGVRKRPKSKLRVTKLLAKAFEKFSNIDTVGLTATDARSIPKTNVNKITKAKIDPNNHKNSKLLNDSKMIKNDLSMKSKRCTAVKRFSKEEDEILFEAYISSKPENSKRLPNDFYKDLSNKMNRSESSLFHRIKRLKSGRLVNKQGIFTLLDDKAIIDEAVENLKEVKSLRNTTIANRDELAIKLGRNKYTLISRWYYRIKPWIMSYYEKTLNLDIRVPLASFVAENFETIYAIDWDLVLERPEFSGHTVGSIRYVYLRMLHLAAWHLKLHSGLVSLGQVAEDAKTTYTLGKGRNIPATTKQRQMEVIEYFENVIKKNGISNFL